MVTVKDVAKHAGVSLGTVSRVLNGAKNVSPKTRELVEGAIRDLGFFPNSAARSLARRSIGTIAVLLRNLHSTFYNDLIRGFEDGMQKEKRNVFFCSLGSDQVTRDSYIQCLTGGMADAIIIYGSLYSDQPMIERLLSIHFPFLLIENNFQSMEVNQFLINNKKGAEEGINHLIGQGHRRIAHFMGDLNKKVNTDRFAGYTEAMQKHSLPIQDGFLFNIYKDYPQAGIIACRLMELPVDQRPTAIFCSNDLIAAHAIVALQKAGYQVPRDISIVAFDDQPHPFDTYDGPRITSVSQPLYQIGSDSIHALAQLLDGTETGLIHRTYETKLVLHDTVAPPPCE